MPVTFSTVGRKNLKQWLTGTPEGRSLIQEIYEEESEFSRRPHILLVQHEKHVSVYGPRTSSAKVVTQPCNLDSIVAETWLEGNLSSAYKDIFWPGNKLADVWPLRVPWQETQHYEDMKKFLRVLDEARKQEEGGYP